MVGSRRVAGSGGVMPPGGVPSWKYPSGQKTNRLERMSIRIIMSMPMLWSSQVPNQAPFSGPGWGGGIRGVAPIET